MVSTSKPLIQLYKERRALRSTFFFYTLGRLKDVKVYDWKMRWSGVDNGRFFGIRRVTDLEGW